MPGCADNSFAHAAPEQAVLEGVVFEIIFRNDLNGYTVLLLDHDDGPTVVGTLPYLTPGERVRFYGHFTEHPDYGRQFSADHYELMAPRTVEAIEQYLSGGLIKGIGKILAHRLVSEFGPDTLDVLQNQPDRAACVKGISLNKALDISRQLNEKKDFQDLLLFLAPLGIGSGKALRIFKRYGKDSIRMISENPYRLADEVFGIGFLTADRLAIKLGLDPESPARLSSAVRYVLTQAALAGHTYLPAPILFRLTEELIKIPISDPDALLNVCLMQKQVILVGGESKKETGQRVALPSLYETELIAARRLQLLLESKNQNNVLFPNSKEAERAVAEACQHLALTLADEQKKALLLALTEPVAILTGGPGTGKTTILRLLCDCLEAKKKQVLLAAPTGRAAKRLSEATGRQAKTLHRLLNLQFIREEGEQALSYQAIPDKTLEADLVIVDEASMIDVFLLRSLLEAIKPGTSLLFVGDADQLPSVGPGYVLRDLIKSEMIPTARLTKVFRQSAESLIIRNAHRIHAGRWPVLDQSHDSQFLFIPREDSEGIAKAVIRLVQDILPTEYRLDPLRDVFVLTPTHKGPAGTQALNQVLQQVLLPPPGKRSYLRSHGRIFGVGDKVMQMRNNYELAWYLIDDPKQKGMGVFNGETGTILAVDDLDRVQVLFDDDRVVFYDQAGLLDLELAYAITIHKSQGSEYPVVVLAIAPGAPQLLSRNLLYTAVTRARQKLLLVSSRKVIGQMLANDRAQNRYTFLKDLLVCKK